MLELGTIELQVPMGDIASQITDISLIGTETRPNRLNGKPEYMLKSCVQTKRIQNFYLHEKKRRITCSDEQDVEGDGFRLKRWAEEGSSWTDSCQGRKFAVTAAAAGAPEHTEDIILLEGQAWRIGITIAPINAATTQRWYRRAARQDRTANAKPAMSNLVFWYGFAAQAAARPLALWQSGERAGTGGGELQGMATPPKWNLRPSAQKTPSRQRRHHSDTKRHPFRPRRRFCRPLRRPSRQLKRPSGTKRRLFTRVGAL